MSHIETLIMNEIRKALEQLERSGVGYIDCETTGNIRYTVDNKTLRVNVSTIIEKGE